MPLDPGLAAMLDLFEQAGYPPMHEGTPADARKAYLALAAASVGDGPVEVGSVTDARVAGRAARVYRPASDGPVPTVLFHHGGGFVIGDLASHDNMCRRLCVDTGSVVVAVDYRLAPEHPFPAAADDAVAAGQDLVSRLSELGGSDVWAVAGDSAGGNLSAVVAQAVPGAAAQLLVYPAVDLLGDYPSRTENAEGYLLDMETMAWFGRHYLSGGGVEAGDAHHSPLHGVRAGLPPAVVVTAGLDPLRDEGRAYAAALREADVPVELLEFDDLIHGFFDLGAFSPAAAEAIATTHRRFRALLHP